MFIAGRAPGGFGKRGLVGAVGSGLAPDGGAGFGAEPTAEDGMFSPGKLKALICGSAGRSPSTSLRSAGPRRGPPPLARILSTPSFKSEAILRNAPRKRL